MLYPILFLSLTYAISAIPFGLVIAKIFAKTDIRELGSKNIGATNVARVVGKKLGFVTLILDGAKGAIMIVIARCLFAEMPDLNIFVAITAAVAVLGHVYPVYLKFKGGKGVATTIAVLVALDPTLGLAVIVAWIVVFGLFRISSISSIIAVASSILVSYFLGAALAQMIVCVFLFFIVLLRHKDNISRLIKGEEGSFKKKSS